MKKQFVYNENMQRYAAAARTAQSNEELASVCEQMNVADRIFLGKVDLWLAKHSLSAVYRTLKKYPALRERINYFGTLNGFKTYKDDLFTEVNPGVFFLKGMAKKATDDIAVQCRAAFEQNCLAMAFMMGTPPYLFSGIIINGKSLHQQTIMANLEYGESSGHSPQGCKSVKSIVEHEIGHLLDFMLHTSSSREYKKFLGQFSVADLERGLSKYSVWGNVVSEREVLAEGYAEYCNNPTPRPIAMTIGEMIDKQYKAKFGAP